MVGRESGCNMSASVRNGAKRIDYDNLPAPEARDLPPLCAIPKDEFGFPAVYEPAEDTYLLADTLHSEATFLKTRFLGCAPFVVEVGCGTGAALCTLTSILGKTSAMYLGTDVNPLAARTCRRNLQENRAAALDVVRTDLVAALSPRLDGQLDVLVFNPPYVPTPSEEVGGTAIAASWAGGLHGREVLDRLLPLLGNLASSRGVVYILAVRENKPAEICNALASVGFSPSIISCKRAHNETLVVIRGIIE